MVFTKGLFSPFQCGNYGIGGWYFIHPDFHPHNDYRLTRPVGDGSTTVPQGGNRVSTVLTVLDAPEAGESR